MLGSEERSPRLIGLHSAGSDGVRGVLGCIGGSELVETRGSGECAVDEIDKEISADPGKAVVVLGDVVDATKAGCDGSIDVEVFIGKATLRTVV